MNDTIAWNDLGFRYVDTGAFLAAQCRNGRWSPLEQCSGGTITLSIAATCLHYGQACFEGLKAFRRMDGSVAAFRPDAHARRLIRTANRLRMIPPDEAMFIEAVRTLLKIDEGHIPPVGSDASFYIRPLLLGTQAVIGVHPSEDYLFLMFGMPVGPYYRHGMHPVRAYVQERCDRAAPRGVGHVKASGTMRRACPGSRSAREGLRHRALSGLRHPYLRRGIRHFEFHGHHRRRPLRDAEIESILESVTNLSLQTIAADLGLRVEHRPVPWSEVESFAEVGACGTAAVITPIHSITRGDKTLRFGSPDRPGPTLQRLYDEIRGIQYGRRPDRHGWIFA